jgi:hypothetical protein
VDFFHHLFGGDHVFALHVPAALRPGLVFDHQARHAGLLKGPGRVVHVNGVAIAGIRVGQQRNGAARGQARDGRQVQLEPHQAHVAIAQQGLT